MPFVTEDQKHVISVMLSVGMWTMDEICERVGPDGYFPFAPAPPATRTIANLKRRQLVSGDVHYRKRRRDATSITPDESAALYVLLRRKSDRYTEELMDDMEEAGMGLAENWKQSTIDDHLRSLCFTVKRTQLMPLGIDQWH
eukprot:COSAG01_NODE_25093_length_756_cov_0.922374_1_plen_141_part_01